MNKSETRELQIIRAYIAAGMMDTAARALSALIRSTMRRSTAQELYRFAVEHDLQTQPDFITNEKAQTAYDQQISALNKMLKGKTYTSTTFNA
jgi:hypothetical protein